MNINLTLIGQSIAFIVFVLFCMKFVWPFITAAMAERQKRIEQGLDSAERAAQDLELAKERSAKILHEAKEQASDIVDSANKRATQIVEEAKQQAREDAERIKAASDAEIEQEINRAKEKLREQVSVLALAGAEKVLEASVDEAAHKSMVDKLAANL